MHKERQASEGAGDSVEYRGSNTGSMMAREFRRARARWCGQGDNSEQHSCPTRLTPALQLHARYMPADLFLSVSSLAGERESARANARSAVSFIFHA